MKCWVCQRQARGYGHTDTRWPAGHAARYPIDWAFCSRRCQDAFHALYGNWVRLREGSTKTTEVEMIDASEVEREAMRKCLKPFGEVAAKIGFDKPLGEYSEAQALLVIDAIVTRYTEALVEHHEQAKVPPVRGATPSPDPMAHPFADLEEDIPWDQSKEAKR